jgi:hypothetical protein
MPHCQTAVRKCAPLPSPFLYFFDFFDLAVKFLILTLRYIPLNPPPRRRAKDRFTELENRYKFEVPVYGA